MRHLLVPLLAALVLACSGGSHSSPPAPAPAPTPVATAVPAGVYTAKLHTTASAALLGATAPIGDITQTMVVDRFGASILELPGWNQVNAVLTALPDGTIQVGSSPHFVTADGTMSDLTLTGGIATSTELSGTVNNGLTFDVVLTPTQTNPIDMATKAGTWISTACNTGQVLVLTIPSAPGSALAPGGGPLFPLSASAYATQADALAGTNAQGTFNGSMYWTQPDPTHQLNLFVIGFTWSNAGAGFVGGLAYFDATGNLVIFTASNNGFNPGWNNQLSAVFTKQ